MTDPSVLQIMRDNYHYLNPITGEREHLPDLHTMVVKDRLLALWNHCSPLALTMGRPANDTKFNAYHSGQYVMLTVEELMQELAARDLNITQNVVLTFCENNWTNFLEEAFFKQDQPHWAQEATEKDS